MALTKVSKKMTSGFGTAALRDVGTAPGNVPVLDAEGKLPSVPSVRWISRVIGEEIWLDDSNPAVDVPPNDNPNFRFIKLTAGENGSGGYNEGVLINETVSGSAPLIEATAEINLPDSPFHGQTVRLLNTERRFVRAGEAGVTQDDAFQGHGHYGRGLAYISGSMGFASSSSYTTDRIQTRNETAGTYDLGYGLPRVADETRPCNIGRTIYMRIL